MYAAQQRWEFTGYIQAYIIYFFVRASVMLFVLRLLPSYKKWQQRVVYAMFLINFLVTLYTCITFGVSCIPFKANWDTVPNAKCFSKDVLVITNQINAGLACACDIVTALIPQFLLWNIQMKARTKRQLNFIFGLGLITALLSIGRAATTTKETLSEDTTWRLVPSYYFTSFECQLGIIIACGPAIRQFWAYRTRTHTSLPTKQRQSPNDDFKKMRYRINLRDIFWYREARMMGDRVFEAAPIFQHKTPPPDASSSDPKSSTKVSNSALDVWEKKIKKVLPFSHNHEKSRRLSSGDSEVAPSELSPKQQSNQMSEVGDLPLKEPRLSRKWGLFSSQPRNKNTSSPRETFLLSDSGAGTNATLTTKGDDLRSSIQDSKSTDDFPTTRLPTTTHGSQVV
ncbi:MAG: hypothetical protein Q9207_007510 [Kuettlingeria erythrocarpa]